MKTLSKFEIFFAAFLLTVNTAGAGSYAVIGDGGEWNPLSKMIENSLIRSGIHDLILAGDNSYGRSYEDTWGQWIADGFRFPIVAIGNHNNGYAKEVRFFGIPGEYYSKWIEPGILAIVLNSDNTNTADVQAAFLEEILATVPAASVFVVYHHPSLSLTTHHQWEERRAFHEQVRPVLNRYRNRITAVFNGHDHIAAAFSFDSLPVLVSGAVHEFYSYSPVNGPQAGIQVHTEWAFDPGPTWMNLVVEPNSNESFVEFIEAKTSLVACRIHLKTGTRLQLENICH